MFTLKLENLYKYIVGSTYLHPLLENNIKIFCKVTKTFQ